HRRSHQSPPIPPSANLVSPSLRHPRRHYPRRRYFSRPSLLLPSPRRVRCYIGRLWVVLLLVLLRCFCFCPLSVPHLVVRKLRASAPS
ncbi:hypothetical protein HN51_049739, partial [Arachis hypogaea]